MTPRSSSSRAHQRYLPASRFEVGGDFYDAFPTNDSSWGFVIGDVCGNGPVAVGRTSCARCSIRGAAMHQPSPQQVLQTVNQALLAEPDLTQEPPFVTALFVGVVHDAVRAAQRDDVAILALRASAAA